MPAKAKLPAQLPLLPLYDSVLLPGAFTRVRFKRNGTISGPVLQHLLAQQGEQIFVAAVPVMQEAPEGQEEGEEAEAVSVHLHDIAAAARVLQMSHNTQDDTWIIMLEGWCRIRLQNPPKNALQSFVMLNIKQVGPGKSSRFKEVELDKEGQELAAALHLGTTKLSELLGQSVGSTATSRLADLLQKLSPPAAADMLASMLTQSVPFKQQVLAAVDYNTRMRLALKLVQQTLERLKGTAKDTAEEGNDTQNKQLVLRRQAYSLLQRAALNPGTRIGGNEPDEEEEEELSALMARLKAAKPPAEVLKVARREHRRLKKSNEQHPGYAISRAYLETLADLPWDTFSGQKKDAQAKEADSDEQHDPGQSGESSTTEYQDEATNADSSQAVADGSSPAQPLPTLAEARQLLDAEHYGLDKVKDRIVQYLAVRRLRGPDARAPILCFVGPPGTGKTSLANSIAKVLQRPFQRVSVGGVRDEAEIRGHRRTYIGAMPGRIIQALRRSGVRDPVLLLDEVDKMGHDSLRGDPAAALLEVLDPNQNQAFVDTYLSVAFDLSQVVFVATANQLQGMSAPLLDRLEIIQLSGYTLEEKQHIAQRHLIPGLLREHGLEQDQLVFPPEALQLVADGYTREAGVRGLSRSLAAICRHIAVQIVTQEDARLRGDTVSSDHSRTALLVATPPNAAHAHQLTPDLASAPSAHLHPFHQPASHAGAASHSVAAAGAELQQASSSMSEGYSEMNSGWDVTALPSAGGLSWGSLWGGLKGAQVPPRASGGHSQAHRSAPQHSRGRHEHSDLLRQDPAATTTEQVQQQMPLSNPYGGMNADMVGAEQPALPCITVTAELIEDVLGPRKYDELDPADSLMSPGSVAGLVWTAAGGQVQFVECCCTSKGHPGRPGKLVLTGQAGEVLQESAHLALSWIRSHSHQLQQAAIRGSRLQQSSTSTSEYAHQQAAGRDSHLQHSSIPEHAHQQAAAHIGRVASAQKQQGEGSYQQPGQLGVGGDDSLAQRLTSGCTQSQHANDLRQAGGVNQTLSQQPGCDQEAQISMQQHPNHWYSTQQYKQHATLDTSDGSLSLPQADRQPRVTCASGLAEADIGSDEAGASGRQGQAERSVDEEGNAVATAAAQWDVHVHLPAGAVSKDGPSAGITLATALVSLFLNRCVRNDTAMTGELTLRGLVLPIGGLKEKLLAAHHAGIKRVLVPKRNWRDVKADVPANIKDSLQVIPVHVLEDVLQHAFDPPVALHSLSKM